MECTNRMCPGEEGEYQLKRIAPRGTGKEGQNCKVEGAYTGIICEGGISR